MGRYRKKTPGIYAEQWLGYNLHSVSGVYEQKNFSGPLYYILDKSGRKVFLEVGDFIIFKRNGLHKVCKPEIFEKLYEKVLG
jgi:hypothetical protein